MVDRKRQAKGESVDTVLDIHDLHYSYGDTVALAGVGLRVGPGECVALLGPNGAGKTTLVNLATGLLARQRGRISLAGGDPRHVETRRKLGVVHQSLGFPRTLRVGELVIGAAHRGGVPRTASGPVLAELGLTELVGRRAATLSGGQQKRLQLAMALVTDPALLVLDEPTAGLDIEARRQFWALLSQRRARGTGVLLTTHLVEEPAAVADRVVVLGTGRVLAADRPAALTARLPDRTVIARTGLAPHRLARLPTVASVDSDGERVRLSTRAPEDLLRVLLAEDPHLSELVVQSASLEQALLHLAAADAKEQVL